MNYLLDMNMKSTIFGVIHRQLSTPVNIDFVI